MGFFARGASLLFALRSHGRGQRCEDELFGLVGAPLLDTLGVPVCL